MKFISLRRLLFVTLLSAASQFAATARAASNWYVSPSGSDSNPGSSSAPFLTIQHAANVVNAGDTVIVKNGTYSNAAASGSGSKLIVMSRGGTASSWITFQAENKWGAVIDGLNNTTQDGWVFGANYIRVQGFEVKGFQESGFQNYSGGQFLDIDGNHIHDIGRQCNDSTQGQEAIFLSSSNVTVQQNLIHDIGRYAPGENGCNPTKPYYQNNDHGIYIDGAFGGANNITIRNNILYNCLRGWAIQVYPNAVSGLVVANNTFAFPNPYRTGHIILAAPVTNSRIQNNIFYQPNTAGLRIDNLSGYSNVAIGNNITYQGTIATASPAGLNFSGNQDNTNPLLVSPSTYDFHLTSGSPAIDTGISLPDVPDDYYSTARPQGAAYDIGVHEFVSGGSAAADMTVTATGPASLTQGQTGASYTMTAKNIGAAGTAGTVTAVDTLTAGLVPMAISGSGWTCVLGTLTCTRSDALAAGSSYSPITLTVDIASNAPSSATSTATVSGGGESNTANDNANYTSAISPKIPDPPLISDMVVTGIQPASLTQGQTGASYTITAKNVGAGGTAGTVTVVDTLTAGLVPTAISGSGWTCVLGTLTCTRPDALAAGSSYPPITLTVDVASNAPSSCTNTATVAGGGETNTANDRVTYTTTISPKSPTLPAVADLTVSKSHSSDFRRGQTGAAYSIVVSNVGSGATAGAVSVTDALPSGLRATALSGTGWTCALGSLTCTRSDALAAGGRYPAISVIVNVDRHASTSVTNTATVSGGGETNTANNVAKDSTRIARH